MLAADSPIQIPSRQSVKNKGLAAWYDSDSNPVVETPTDLMSSLSRSASFVYKELLRDLRTQKEARSNLSGERQEDFELVVPANVTLPRHPQHCNCGQCSKQGTVLIVNDSQCRIHGRFESGPPHGEDVKVLLEYVMIHVPFHGNTNDETHCDVWVLRQLGVVDGAELCVQVPAKHLVSTFHGRFAIKDAIAAAQAPLGTFHTHIRAGVTCTGAQGTRSFAVYSPELYVCGARNLRRISKLQ